MMMQQGHKWQQLSDEMQHSLNEAAMLYPDLSKNELVEVASRLSGAPEFMFSWLELHD
jgi:hypothetical protein